MELNETGLSHSNPWPEHEGEQSLKGERAGTVFQVVGKEGSQRGSPLLWPHTLTLALGSELNCFHNNNQLIQKWL